MKGWTIAAVALVAGLAIARPAAAGSPEDAGWGALSVLTNLVYMPAKLVYATLGGLTGGLVYGLTAGDLQTAQAVWTTTMGGTYVVTPGMLQGQEPIAFSGTPGGTAPTPDSNHELHEQPLGGNG
jgi:hypothetical protein